MRSSFHSGVDQPLEAEYGDIKGFMQEVMCVGGECVRECECTYMRVYGVCACVCVCVYVFVYVFV